MILVAFTDLIIIHGPFHDLKNSKKYRFFWIINLKGQALTTCLLTIESEVHAPGSQGALPRRPVARNIRKRNSMS